MCCTEGVRTLPESLGALIADHLDVHHFGAAHAPMRGCNLRARAASCGYPLGRLEAPVSPYEEGKLKPMLVAAPRSAGRLEDATVRELT